MTICVAAIFQWIYDQKGDDVGGAIITASDRMLTDQGLGIEYEPNQYKGAHLTRTAMALIAGDVATHSSVLQRIIPELQSTPEANVGAVAAMYAKYMRDYISARASHKYLSPLSLDTKSFIRNQKTMDSNLVIELSQRLLEESVEAEALIVGCEGKAGHIYSINGKGIMTCHDDLGFGAIGLGGIHAAGQIMNYGYTNRWQYYQALSLVYSAKKRAEVAPGVGSNTDIFLITRDGWTYLHADMQKELARLYKSNENKKRIADAKAVEKLALYGTEFAKKQKKEAAIKEQAET